MTGNTVTNWLKIAFQQPLDCESETFYFDKSDKQFFSILSIEYLLFDKKYNLTNDISLYYTVEEIDQLAKRLKAIQKKKNSILLLPRYGIIQEPSNLLKYIDEFLVQNRIDIKSCTIFEIYQKEPIIKKKNVKKPWWKFF
jgi:hypothetical protein